MFKAILFKEFLKIRYIYLALFIFIITMFSYLYFQIIKSFFSIEPHSMLWYEAVFIGNIYYDILKFVPSICAIILAFAQFLPEVQNKKFRIPLHLPINQNKMLILYLSVGIFLLSFLNILFLFLLYFISSSFYTNVIIYSALKNSLPWLLSSYIIYNALASIMVETYWKRRAFLVVLFTLLSSMLFINNNYEAYNKVLIMYFFIFIFSFFVPLLSLYRFKNGNTTLDENHTLISKFASLILIIFSFLVLSFYLPKIYSDLIKNDSLATYVFYSSKNKEFIYKKHFGEHNFTYGTSKGETISSKEFEEALPFVYWRNLDIQKKLPINIDGTIYTKTQIRKARQSFKFDFRDLHENKKQIALYPLFKPNSKKGMIAFPNEMFTLNKNFTLYDSEENSINKKLSEKYTKIFEKKNFLFPAKIIAGKTTNIKPLDEGYFILDSKDDLFHMKVYDNQMHLKKIAYDKNIKIKDIKISESRKKEFYGVLLNKKNELYIITYKDYKLKKLELPLYDAKTMKVEIYANPMIKLLRFQDKKHVFTIAYDKNFRYIDQYKSEIPQVNNYFTKAYKYLFAFTIKKDEYKNYEKYNFEFNSYFSYILNLILAFCFLIFTKFKNTKENLIKIVLLLLGGIYTLFFISFI